MGENITLKHLSYVELHDFHGNPMWASKEWGWPYKNTQFSAATHPELSNLVPTE